MEQLVIIKSVSPAREFESTQNGQTGSVKCIDVVLGDGLNNFVATAFNAVAQKIIDHPMKIGALVNVDLSFSVRNAKNDKGQEWYSQQVRLNNYAVLVEP